jgi:hypothetical protein
MGVLVPSTCQYTPQPSRLLRRDRHPNRSCLPALSEPRNHCRPDAAEVRPVRRSRRRSPLKTARATALNDRSAKAACQWPLARGPDVGAAGGRDLCFDDPLSACPRLWFATVAGAAECLLGSALDAVLQAAAGIDGPAGAA